MEEACGELVAGQGNSSHKGGQPTKVTSEAPFLKPGDRGKNV